MSATSVGALRLLLPRWRKMQVTSALGELDSFANSAEVGESELQELDARRLEWLDNRSLSFAAEFASTALVVRRPEAAMEAAEFIVENAETATASSMALATRVLSGDREPHPNLDVLSEADGGGGARNLEIRALRTRLGRNPRNAVAWADLARAHAVMGHHAKATRAMTSAVGLASQNRFILRAGARLMVLTDRPDQAHAMLVRSDSVRHDPWVAAAEIAVAEAAEKPPAFVKSARKLLESGDFSPRHLTELAGVLATVELHAGRAKRARRLFERSLVEPNENALAQAEWASGQLSGLKLSPADLGEPGAFEARARFDTGEGLWSEALDETWKWHADQAFAADASLLGSYVAAVGLLNFEEAIRFADAGLKANPGNPRLLNNLAYALLELDRVDEAAARLGEVQLEEADSLNRLVILATRGLLAYKLGEPGRGRELYRHVISVARQKGAIEIAAMAALLMARQEIRAGGEDAAASLETALALARSTRDSGVQAWRSRLEDYRP